MEAQDILIKTEPFTVGAHEHNETADRVLYIADSGLSTGTWSSCIIQQLQADSSEASALQNAAVEGDVKIQTVSSLEGRTLIATTDLVFSTHGVQACDGVSMNALQTEMGTSAMGVCDDMLGVCDDMSVSAVQTEINAAFVSGDTFSQIALQTETTGIAGLDGSGIHVTVGYPVDPADVKLEIASPAYEIIHDAAVHFHQTHGASSELTETNSEGRTVNAISESSTESQIRIYESPTGLTLSDVAGITIVAQPEDLCGETQDNSAVPTGLYKNVYVKEEPEDGTGVALASSAGGPCVDFHSFVVGANTDDFNVQTVLFAQELSTLTQGTKGTRRQRSAPSISTVSSSTNRSPVKLKGDHQDTASSVKKITECFVKLVRLPDGMLSRSGIFRVPRVKDPQLEAFPVDLSKVKTEDVQVSSFFHQDDFQDNTPVQTTEDSKSDLREGLRKRLQSAVGSSREKLMKLHQSQSKHSAAGPRNYFCNICGRGYKTASGCSQHKKVHFGLKEHKCQECGKCFMYKSTLTKHMDIHADIRPYPCPLCSKAFRWSSHLKMHLGRHSSERPYVCEECGRRFKQPDTLHNHMITHSSLRPWNCSGCKESFKTKSALKLHMRRHTGEKPYQCRLCSATFSHANTLVVHMRGIHTGERPYKCKLCQATFTQGSHLRIHMPIHSDPKREARLRRALQKKQSGQSNSRLSRLVSKLNKSAAKVAQKKTSKLSVSNAVKKTSATQGVSKGAAKPSLKKMPKQSMGKPFMHAVTGTVNSTVSSTGGGTHKGVKTKRLKNQSLSKGKSSESKSSRPKSRSSGKLKRVGQTPVKSKLISEGHDHLSNNVSVSSTSVSNSSETNPVGPGVLEDSSSSEVYQSAIPSPSVPESDPSSHAETKSATSAEDLVVECVLKPAAPPRKRSNLGGAPQIKSKPATDLQSVSDKGPPIARGLRQNASSQKWLKPNPLPALTKVASQPASAASPQKTSKTDCFPSSRSESGSSPSSRSKTDSLSAGGSKMRRLPLTLDSLPMTVLFYRPLLLQAVQRKQQQSGQTGAPKQTAHGGSGNTRPENDVA